MGIIDIILDQTLPIAYFEIAVPVPTGSPRIFNDPITSGIVITYDHHGMIRGYRK
jgi:hypothetical protein